MASHKSEYYKQNKAKISRKLRIDTSGKETGASKGRRFVLWGGITAIIALFVVVGTAGLGTLIAPPTQAVLSSESHAIDVFSPNGSKLPFALVSNTAEYTSTSNTTYILTNVTVGEMAHNNVGKISVNLTAGAAYTAISVVSDPNLVFPDSSIGTLYNVTFTEQNLTLPHYNWTVNVTNSTGVSHLFTTNKTSDTLALLNGSYSFKATTTESDFATLASSYNLTVDGAKLSINVSFSQKFIASLNEKGLPSGKEWTAFVSHQFTSSAAAGRAIPFTLFNGSYSYQVFTNDTAMAALPGDFTVAGANLTVNVTFSKAYNVTFHETGLPANTMWFVNLTVNGAEETVFNFNASQITANMSAPLSNATYQYTGFGFNNTTKDLYMTSFGNFTVKGANLTVNLTFARGYAVIFLEKGLPSGTSWYIKLNTGQVLSSASFKLNSTTTTLAVFGLLKEGNYTYTPRISVAGYTATSGKLDLTNNTMVNVTFTQVLPPPPLITATITIGFGTSVSNFVPVVSNVTNISYAMLLIQPYFLTGNQSNHLMIEVNTSTGSGLKYVTFELLGNNGTFSSFGPIYAEDFGYVAGGTIILALTFASLPWIAIYREEWVMSGKKVS